MIQNLFRNIKVSALTGALCFFSTAVQASASGSTANDCTVNCTAGTCSELAKTGNQSQTQLFLLAIVLFMLALFFSKQYKNKLYLAGGSVIALFLLAIMFFNPFIPAASSQNSKVEVSSTPGSISDVAPENEFKSTDNDFVPVNSGEFSRQDSVAGDLLAMAGSSAEFSQAGTDFVPAGSEFANTSDKLGTKSISEKKEISPSRTTPNKVTTSDNGLLYQLGVLFLLLLLISFLIRYKNFRKIRGLILITSVAYLGFFKGGCPCMISSLQNTILAIIGQPVEWVSLVWFLGLIPLTFIGGKIWCGWLCHLGGLQDFLFQSPTLNVLKSEKVQHKLRYFRIGFLAALIIQLLITKTNIYIHFDPFKVAFNLFSANITGYVLLFLLLVSSVLIYRPFCRAVCPVGLILGWVSLIPGARRLSKSESCVDCITCSKKCRSNVLIYEKKKNILNVQDCILCGDCLGSCKKDSLYLKSLKK